MYHTAMVRHEYERNPAWVTRALARSYSELDQFVPPAWLPRITLTSLDRKINAMFKEYGCGVYGCVLPTYTPNIVCKVTTDDTEAEFAATMAKNLPAPICVEYYRVVNTTMTRTVPQGTYRIHLLWRESAEEIGKLPDELTDPQIDLFDEQHRLAESSYVALSKIMKKPPGDRSRPPELEMWAETLEIIAGRIPQITELAEGMLLAYRQQRILFGDIHFGNVGKVGDRWVITDPGNIAVVNL